MYYYILTGSYWSHQSKILAKDGVAGDRFGRSASIYDNKAFIGASEEDDKASDAGIYESLICNALCSHLHQYYVIFVQVLCIIIL